MKRHFIYLFTLVLFFAISSCEKSRLVSTFDENIKIRMTETVDSVKRVLSFNCFTEKIFGCSNLGIQSAYSVTKDKITINFIKITSPKICLTSLGSAATIINLNELANKTYELELNVGTAKITGQLDVTTESIVATIPTQTKISFVNPELKRIPDNTIFGTVDYHSASSGLLVQNFLDSLQIYGATPSLYPPGDYGQFEIEPDGQIKQKQDLGYYFTRYFIFNYPGNSAQLKGLVKRFGINYGEELSITLNTTKGETFYSWAP